MSLSALARLFATYAAIVAIACVTVARAVAIDPRGAPREVVASVWQRGQIVARAVLASKDARDAAIDEAMTKPGAVRVDEIVVDEGPLLTKPELAFALSIVAGVDGVKATLAGKTAYVTPDELLARQAYDKDQTFPELSLSVGTDVQIVLALLADRLGATAPDILAKATIHRIRVRREVHGAPRDARVVSADAMTNDDVRTAMTAAAKWLARGQKPDGRYRYLVDAPSDRTLPGYDLPRHAGATFFLAQAAGATGDAELTSAALRGAGWMRDSALATCGENKCVASDDVADLGSASLALVAFSEIVLRKLDDGYRPLVAELARFVRAQERPDGEFMHQYDRGAKRPIDIQLLYYSGEATLALSRASRITNDAADLEGAKRGLAHLVGPAWSFFGDRYYFGEEHWTCQALADLWERAPDRHALDFCLRWSAFNRAMQIDASEVPYDADGAFGVTAIVTPRLTPVASRGEAGVATLAVARFANVDASEIAALDRQLRRSLSLLVRHQFTPGLTHLFANPDAVLGAIPGSPVDWQLRIDYAQHAGSAMIRWLEVNAAK